MHLHLAFHLGTLDEPCEGHDVGAEPKDGVWWTYPEGLTNTNLVLDHMQAPEHSKPPMFLQISLEFFYV